jgi:hypothetical protein
MAGLSYTTHSGGFVSSVVGGGVASKLGGGSFGEGALLAAEGYEFNHVLHARLAKAEQQQHVGVGFRVDAYDGLGGAVGGYISTSGAMYMILRAGSGEGTYAWMAWGLCALQAAFVVLCSPLSAYRQ